MFKEKLVAIYECLLSLVFCILGIAVGLFFSYGGIRAIYYWSSSKVISKSEFEKLIMFLVGATMALGGITIIAKSIMWFVKGVKSGEFTAARVAARREWAIQARNASECIEIEADEELNFLRSLLPEVGPEICRRSKCNHKRVWASKFCAKHQFELEKKKPCPWEISQDGKKVKE